jgi:UDP-N-acetylmuramoylalanine--D-glutamate ligase
VTSSLSELTSWHSDWAGIRAVVFGLGASGFSVSDTLAELGCTVLVVADSAEDLRVTMCDVIGVEVVLTAGSEPVPAKLDSFNADIAIVSPGFAPSHALVAWAALNGIPMWTDIDLAWRLRDKVGQPAEWLLVTGTNGKTTTTQLAAHMLAAGGYRVAPCGNIGVPILDAIRDPEGFDFFVVELSSYQLHYTGDIFPHSAVCLNIADDHLDWHGSLQAYVEAKAKIFHNVRVACVYNKSDPLTEAIVEGAEVMDGARAIGFGLGVPGMSDLGLVEEVLCDRAFLEDRRDRAIELTTLDELADFGLGAPHMVANVLAASALARACDVSAEDISIALASFQVDAHRHEKIAEVGGVTWIDDSKATNPHAADAALSAHQSVVWIVGGLFKGVEIDALISKHVERLRGVVVIGADQSEVIRAFERHAPGVPLHRVVTAETSEVMPLAVNFALGLAQSSDVVLLAPAAASMDQFRDYAHRGESFVEAVKRATGGADV